MDRFDTARALVLAAGIWSYAAVGTEKPVSQKATI